MQDTLALMRLMRRGIPEEAIISAVTATETERLIEQTDSVANAVIGKQQEVEQTVASLLQQLNDDDFLRAGRQQEANLRTREGQISAMVVSSQGLLASRQQYLQELKSKNQLLQQKMQNLASCLNRADPQIPFEKDLLHLGGSVCRRL